ncbi:uroporphyrinogen decarboxylase family protein [Pontiella agarivorans]|uniref:Uroporphyrinogen decarboxylase family protein n=1 Tax=Pontiella agarivorans TaxID=3038953 RepID=A0ABU5N2B0_9BACT|nr:uroporphyrinogen decarboxylase family protein [Pontiella agarivorans]MDZ8120548.1 uroporphyrinogen decarboxylase family protein [Pontiella agarivorans]
MTSRERVLAAINHQSADQLPVDLGSNPSSGISAMGYNKLKKALGIQGGHTRIYDVVQQLAQPEMEVLDALGCDVLDIGRIFNTADEDWYDITLPDGTPAQYPKWFRPLKRSDGAWEVERNGEVIARMPPDGAFFDQTWFPYEEDYPESYDHLDDAMNMVLWQSMAHSPWDHADDPKFWTTLRENTLRLRDESDKALMIVCGCNLFEWGTFLRKLDNFLMDLLTEPEAVTGLLDELMKRHLRTLEKVCEAVGDCCDILRFGDDLGTTGGLFMPPDTYRELFKPHHTRLNAFVHENSQMKTFLHSCGSIYRIMPDLIEAGYDIINPVQTNCFEMEPERLKKEFGDQISFWGGGCDTASVLNKATPAGVREHVLERCELFGRGGGFIFNTIHNILPEVPAENTIAAFDAVKEFNQR